MAIKRWHYGKLVVLWAWGGIITLVIVRNLESTNNYLLGFLLIGLVIIIPFILSIITWKWLSGKEK